MQPGRRWRSARARRGRSARTRSAGRSPLAWEFWIPWDEQVVPVAGEGAAAGEGGRRVWYRLVGDGNAEKEKVTRLDGSKGRRSPVVVIPDVAQLKAHDYLSTLEAIVTSDRRAVSLSPVPYPSRTVSAGLRRCALSRPHERPHPRISLHASKAPGSGSPPGALRPKALIAQGSERAPGIRYCTTPSAPASRSRSPQTCARRSPRRRRRSVPPPPAPRNSPPL